MAVELEPGEGFVPGLAPETARLLLAKAEEQGLDPRVVRTTSEGFVVPGSLIEDDDKEAAAPAKAPTKRAASRKPAASDKKGS